MNRDKQAGFNLVELLAVTTVLILFVSLALPSFQKLSQNNRDEALRNLLISQINQTRANSIIFNKHHILCGSSDGETCDHAWQTGWLIREKDSRKIIHIERLNAQPRLTWRGLSKQIRFLPSGHSNASNGTFTLCDDNAQVVWQVKLSRQGRARTVKAETAQNAACSHS